MAKPTIESLQAEVQTLKAQIIELAGRLVDLEGHPALAQVPGFRNRPAAAPAPLPRAQMVEFPKGSLSYRQIETNALDLIREGKRIEAIKFIRHHTDKGLGECLDVVQELERRDV